MKKMLMVMALAPTLLFGGCATTGTGGLTQDQINAFVAQIQAYTVAACSFQPTAATVATLIGAFAPGAATVIGIVNSIGDAICKAPVTASAVKRGSLQQSRVVQTPKGPVTVKGLSVTR